MFYQLLLIHLYRPFLKYTRSTSPLPQHVSPRKLCTQAASAISKLLRLYKRSFGFDQICNIAVYIAHTACTIHLLNCPEKSAQKDLIQGLRHLEEMAERWLCARRTLRILDISASKWQVKLPNEALAVFARTHTRWGSWGSWDQAVSPTNSDESPTLDTADPSVTIPSGIGTGFSGGQHVDPSPQGPANFVGPMGVPGRPASSIPNAMSSMPPPRRSASAQLQPMGTPLPEPTYLRPASHMFYPVQTAVPQNEAWYGETPLSAMSNEQTISPTEAPSMGSFDATDNLVEESQDWWTRNPTTLNLGIDNWDGIPPGLSRMDYSTSTPSSGVNNGPISSQPLRFPGMVPPNVNPNDYSNESVFPNSFPQ